LCFDLQKQQPTATTAPAQGSQFVYVSSNAAACRALSSAVRCFYARRNAQNQQQQLGTCMS
jgi:hypothetical protein